MDRVCNLLLPCDEERVLLRLARHANDQGGSCRPGMDLLTAETGRGCRTIQRALKDLEARGYIRAVAYRNGGQGRVTEWVLCLETWVEQHQPNPDTNDALLNEYPVVSDAEPRRICRDTPSFLSQYPDKYDAPVGHETVIETVIETVSVPPAKKPRARKVAVPIDDAYLDDLVAEFASKLGGAEQVRKKIARALNHQALNRANDKRLRLRHWLEDDVERSNGGSRETIHPRGSAANHSTARGGSDPQVSSGGGSDPFAAFSRPERFSRLSVLRNVQGRGEGAEECPIVAPGLREGPRLPVMQSGERAEVAALVHA